MYIDLTLNEFVRKYTGVHPGAPDTQEVLNYRKAIKFFLKFDMDRTILEQAFKAKLRVIAKEKNCDPADLWQHLMVEI